MSPHIELSLGPLLFNWSEEKRRDFYARIADETPIDTVYLGEAVCSKRLPFFADSILETAERLQRAGKRVVLSSLALPVSPSERQLCRDIAETGFRVEVNDLTALAFMPRPGAFHVGPFVNVYNESTLRQLAEYGATSICLPPELPFSSIRELTQAALPLAVDCEVWAFGRVPLAISGRCYHARVNGLTKDSCQFVCARDEDGLDVKSLNEGRLFAINGVQTLSQSYYNLLSNIEALVEAGIASFRLSPHSCDMVGVSGIFRCRLDGAMSADEAQYLVSDLCPDIEFSNGFLFGEKGVQFTRGSGDIRMQ